MKFRVPPSGDAGETSITWNDFLQQWHKAEVREDSPECVLQGAKKNLNLESCVELSYCQLSSTINPQWLLGRLPCTML